MSRMFETQKLVDNFTSDLVRVSPTADDWARWVLYALEALQNETDGETYREFLKSVLDGVDSRLEFGRW